MTDGKENVLSPSEHQTQQGADEDEHLVEHGRVGPLDGSMEIILDRRREMHTGRFDCHIRYLYQ